MNTSEFEPSNPAQQGFTASLPDVEQLTRLANELFSALPCNGSRLGIAASSVPGGSTSPLAGFDKFGAPAQDFGLPGEADLRQLFAPRQPSFESVPDSLDTGSVLGNSSPTTASSLSDFDKSVLAGILPNDYGLPGIAELQKLLVSRTPSGSHLPGTGEAQALPSAPASLTEIQASADNSNSAVASLSPQVFEAPVQKLFAADASVPESLAKNATETYGLAGTQTDFDPSLIAGLSPEVYGLPGEAELLKLFGAFSAPSGNVPTNAETGSSFYFLDELKTGGFNAKALGSAHPPFDVHAVRRDFPILKERVNGYPLVWFDNAATTQKPQVVIDRVSYFYEHENSNIHRAAHELAARATDAYEKARDTVAHF